ncbi:hypothetical protein F511_08618 [Dorcoceras hygrometricum]|uniref:Uncharacterized protein n=1 Tax=Dorcoceras hygrometricum TaxID=472368 RepID=A0A2Z7CLU0_9LAMI|nr:hypothetical protein F511_08618 [Dorcoceras hygrometricum]
MGRGRVELKRIENKINRQVTFAKRRNGLLKKAYELSVLCDAEVALIIFSTRGKLYEFCSSSNMLKTLERYQKCSYGSLEVNHPTKDIEQSSYVEYVKLKSKYESLQRCQRHLLGDDLGPLSMNDLEQIEAQLETSLHHIRSTREKLMLEANSSLERKLQELYAGQHFQQSWVGGEQSNAYTHHHNVHSQGFFQPLQCNSNLQIGYNDPANSSQMSVSMNHGQNDVTGLVPGWML